MSKLSQPWSSGSTSPLSEPARPLRPPTIRALKKLKRAALRKYRQSGDLAALQTYVQATSQLADNPDPAASNIASYDASREYQKAEEARAERKAKNAQMLEQAEAGKPDSDPEQGEDADNESGDGANQVAVAYRQPDVTRKARGLDRDEDFSFDTFRSYAAADQANDLPPVPSGPNTVIGTTNSAEQRKQREGLPDGRLGLADTVARANALRAKRGQQTLEEDFADDIVKSINNKGKDSALFTPQGYRRAVRRAESLGIPRDQVDEMINAARSSYKPAQSPVTSAQPSQPRISDDQERQASYEAARARNMEAERRVAEARAAARRPSTVDDYRNAQQVLAWAYTNGTDAQYEKAKRDVEDVMRRASENTRYRIQGEQTRGVSARAAARRSLRPQSL